MIHMLQVAPWTAEAGAMVVLVEVVVVTTAETTVTAIEMTTVIMEEIMAVVTVVTTILTITTTRTTLTTMLITMPLHHLPVGMVAETDMEDTLPMVASSLLLVPLGEWAALLLLLKDRLQGDELIGRRGGGTTMHQERLKVLLSWREKSE